MVSKYTHIKPFAAVINIAFYFFIMRALYSPPIYDDAEQQKEEKKEGSHQK